MASGTDIDTLKACRDLVEWATGTAGTPGRIYEHEGSSLEDAGGNVPTDERYSNSASSDSTNYVAIIRGWIYPSNAPPFNGQRLPIEIRVPDGYPAEPPEVYMRIQLRHPNIEKNGQICTELLDPETEYEDMSLIEVVQLVVKLMKEPETDSGVDTEALCLYEEDQSTYNQNITAAVMAQVQR
ncbi:unnamed protein product [Adineta ricciae]|uniref:UBC core domain-containing protein n=1 Tax=Adineta ricciae TaxID=249248 RepID=A0A814F945_ADIRI|nr:unnamed protein product [Adineta ricciae]CAF1242564.1 unnamed protein product [Adineta ricciae]